MENLILCSNKPRWTFACTRCDWKGVNPERLYIYGYCDCPDCGSSCTDDEESFEPEK